VSAGRKWARRSILSTGERIGVGPIEVGSDVCWIEVDGLGVVGDRLVVIGVAPVDSVISKFLGFVEVGFGLGTFRADPLMVAIVADFPPFRQPSHPSTDAYEANLIGGVAPEF